MKKNILIAFVLLFSFQFLNAQDCLNIKYKLRGYFYAGSSIEDSTALGGHYSDKNYPKSLEGITYNSFENKPLQIIVKEDSIVNFNKNTSGFKVFIINNSKETIKLQAQDSRLYVKKQVFFKNEWKDIEYLPNSWCGNSYHSVYINPNEFWDFNAPCTKGKIKAKFRYALTINKEQTIYSNIFSGSFNKKQLTKEEGHTPSGLMDPYNN